MFNSIRDIKLNQQLKDFEKDDTKQVLFFSGVFSSYNVVRNFTSYGSKFNLTCKIRSQKIVINDLKTNVDIIGIVIYGSYTKK